MKYVLTQSFKKNIAATLKDYIGNQMANTYICIGRPLSWNASGTGDEFESQIVQPEYTTNERNQVFRDMIAMKRVLGSEVWLVVPRVDWAYGIFYDRYDDHEEMFTHDRMLALGTASANANVNISGTGNIYSTTGTSNGDGSVFPYIIYGKNTLFRGNVFVDDVISVNNEYRTVMNVYNDTQLLMNANYSVNATNQVITLIKSPTVIFKNTAVFYANTSVGNVVMMGTDRREIVQLQGNTRLKVNSAFLVTHNANTDISRVDNKYPKFGLNFYVRNSRDQVFKCLDNNGGIASTSEPVIDINGQLPENPYVQTGDGYKWKYLYTVPYGLKYRFFTKGWMPVTKDSVASYTAVDGRIDTIDVTYGGTGYLLDGGGSGNSNSADFITISGDGSEEAIVTTVVQSGVITKLNIINGGRGYTYANVVIDDAKANQTGSNIATFDVSISPSGGHGSDPAEELGCFSVMISSELDGSEGGLIPISGADDFDYRQISVVNDPVYANGRFGAAAVYSTTTRLLMNSTSGSFDVDETVANTASGLSMRCVEWDSANNFLYVNNIYGALKTFVQLTGNTSGAISTIVDIKEPEIAPFTGKMLYIENRDKVVRSADQSEQIRLVFSF